MTGNPASVRNRIALGLLALALAVRVLVPAGWMPAASAQGFAITLCSVSGAETVWVDRDGKLHKQAPKTSGDQHCAFAGLAAPLTGSDTPVLTAPFAHEDRAAIQSLPASPGQGLAAPPPPATGPPAYI